ncbi:MAG: SMP-30/gluconolactonase/LRE family protein [Methylobacterium sp.]|jgi:sugar lactone lactonase YvrE/DNA-binding IclR family transcriptional regulator|nr:SMP-30/gluconolactonase/LRE family protein [Methylobacterium sp.]MCA3597574.1 SMP-30/gluconolactonase/LRE family protein [Methylobacterium sp.]MCA3603050.1 SMP-30/gluconolactonase/LRE family protein [Methylobacterium sp.]MCA3605814.1 SMP-30/gluconolactonase/LRE family protein [Methylobacterium sp.]MCA3610083.1 SMP-30/gluconolactonase/LRE family protein [Methylobacterium sp.]
MAGEAQVLKPDERDVPGGAAALAKGLYLLDLIGERDQPARFKDLQIASGLPKGTLARMLNTLVTFRLVRHEPSDNTYRLGNRLFELAHRVWETFDLRGAAAPQLERLATETHETVALTAMDNDQVIYIDQRSGGGPFGFRIEVGRRAPLHCTAPGKALLAFSPPHDQRMILARIPLEQHTTTTITDAEQLVADLAITRARGYSISLGEHLDGVVSAAAPVFDHTGKAIAAIGVFGPSARIGLDRLHIIGRDLMEAARMISGNVGASLVSIQSKSAPPRAVSPNVECVLPWGANLAEGPVWSARENRLYWIDILAPAVYRFDPATGTNDTCPLPRLVGAIVERKTGGLAALTMEGLEALDFDRRALAAMVDPEADKPENRFNDGKCDAQGRLWAGTMSLDAMRKTGSIYRIDPDLRWQRMDGPFTVANGLDWSPDGRTFYFADSAAGAIYAYDFDPARGTLAHRRVFAMVDPADGRPDGLTVDAEGCVWSALWDGWAVRRFDPSGRMMSDLRLPVPRPTSVAFGGADYRTLYITSARIRLPARILADAPFSGGIFAADAGVAGWPAGQFAG